MIELVADGVPNGYVTLYQLHQDVRLNTKDLWILHERLYDWLKEPRIRGGDFIINPRSGLQRIAHVWYQGSFQDSVQPTSSENTGSFYIDRGARGSYSGPLEPSIPVKRLKLNPCELRKGHFWFFHEDMPKAHSAVGCTLPCRVYEVDWRDHT